MDGLIQMAMDVAQNQPRALSTTKLSTSKAELAALAVALGAPTVKGWSEQEIALVDAIPPCSPQRVSEARQAIARGEDPLGDLFGQLLSAEERRPLGATYTPAKIVTAMLDWAVGRIQPERVVDPGAGSARFLVAAGRRFTEAQLVAIECDPLAASLARGHLAAAGLAERSHVIVADYREVGLPTIQGRTLYIGNPPYVRHHLLGERWKHWLVSTAQKYGLKASKLAGLHAHFFLATAEFAKPGDVGVFITAAEWLDVNYGQLVRESLLNILGVQNLQLIEPTALPFPGTATTAVITGFAVGIRSPSVGLRRVATLDELGALEAERQVPREQLVSASRWTPLTRSMRTRHEGFIELGELCRVHRGQVTGTNRVWIDGPHSVALPDSVKFHSVTKAHELFAAKDVLYDALHLRRVIDLPADLSELDSAARRVVDQFLQYARLQDADQGFIARHRKAWWSVGLRQPAPILATYMARRPPVFIRNLAGARHINIAHGLYPREPLVDHVLDALAMFLSQSTSLTEGRTYAGGLTKFEPKEMERLLVPRPELLATASLAELLV